MKQKTRITAIDQCIATSMRKLRAEHKLSQRDMAFILGVTFQQVQKYEKATNRLSAARLYILHRYFDVPLDYFFTGLKNPPEIS